MRTGSHILKDMEPLVKEEDIRAFNHLLYLFAGNQGSTISMTKISNIMVLSMIVGTPPPAKMGQASSLTPRQDASAISDKHPVIPGSSRNLFLRTQESRVLRMQSQKKTILCQ